MERGRSEGKGEGEREREKGVIFPDFLEQDSTVDSECYIVPLKNSTPEKIQKTSDKKIAEKNLHAIKLHIIIDLSAHISSHKSTAQTR